MNSIQMRRGVWCATLLMASVATATEYVFDVPEGVTNDFASVRAASNYTAFVSGDTIVKSGEGTLIGTNAYSSLVLNLRVAQGVFVARRVGDLFKASSSRNISVWEGASLVIDNKGGNADKFAENAQFWVYGAGHPAAASADGRTGALVFRGNADYQVLNFCTINLCSDTTLSVDIGGNNGCFSYCTINGQGHRLTLIGPGCTAGASGVYTFAPQFRFRFGYGFTNLTDVVVRGAELSAHNVAYTALPSKVSARIEAGGALGVEGQPFMNCFGSLYFARGSFFGSSEQNGTVNVSNFSGFPTMTSKFTPTVTGCWTLPASDMVAGGRLFAANTLTFKTGSTFTIADTMALDPFVSYLVATSAVSVAGTPASALGTDESPHWTVAPDAAGKALVCSYVLTKPAGAVDARADLGLVPGVASAAANTAAVKAALASLADNAVVFFPQGFYYFSEPLALTLGTTRNVALVGDGFAVLAVTDTTADAVLKVTGGENVTVTGFRFADCSGVAVAANGTAGLTITNNICTNVVGAIASVDGTYPYAATGCTDLYVKGNSIRGTAAYTALAYKDDATTLRAGSEPQSDEVIFDISWNDYAALPFDTAVVQLGLAAYPDGARLVKRGAGHMAGPTTEAQRLLVNNIDIEEGTFVATQNKSLGRSNGTRVLVREGATLLLVPVAADSVAANNIRLVFEGAGAASARDSALAMKGAGWQTAVGCTFVLSNKVSVYYAALGQSGVFSSCTIEQNGYPLTLTGSGTGSEIRFRNFCTFKNAAPFIVSNATLSASCVQGGTEGWTCPDGRVPCLTTCKPARLVFDTQAFYDVFETIDCEAGTTIACRSNNTFKVSKIAGAPALEATATWTVTNSLTAKAVDLVAGKKLTSVNALTFGPDATLEIDAAANLPERVDGAWASYTIATSDASIVGKPKLGSSFAGTPWRLRFADAGKTLALAPPDGTMLLLR